jgi:hypothetical protein
MSAALVDVPDDLDQRPLDEDRTGEHEREGDDRKEHSGCGVARKVRCRVDAVDDRKHDGRREDRTPHQQPVELQRVAIDVAETEPH